MKDFDTMQLLWQQDPGTGRFSIDADSMHKEILKQSKRFHSQVRFRDYMEGTLGFLIATFFAVAPILLRGSAPWYADWAWFVLSGGCLLVACAFVYQRRQARQWKTDDSQPIRTTLLNARDHLDHQIHALKNVLWWYCLPIELPLLLVTFTSPMFEGFRVTYALATLVFMVGIVAYNLWHVRRNLMPQRDAVVHLLESTAEE